MTTVPAEQVIEQATAPIKSSTHKIIKATYIFDQLYAVPNSWSIDDIYIRYGTIYYKDVDVEKYIKVEEREGDREYPEKIQDDGNELDEYFDCEEEEKGCMKCGVRPRHNQTDEDGSYLCLSCEDEDEFECELCKKIVNETEYLPSIEDDETGDALGYDYCLDCYKKVKQFIYIEEIAICGEVHFAFTDR